MGEADCYPDEMRFYDPETRQWGYMVECITPSHSDRVCPCDRELFREAPVEAPQP